MGSAHTSSLVSDAAKKSRWDVSEQQKKEETLNELISAARQQSSAHTPPTSTSRAEVQLQHRPPLESRFSPSPLLTQAKNSDEEEDQEEESRPPMDLFKAIFSDSSEEKSSSSSSEAESNDEDQAKNKEPADLFLITSSTTTAATSSTTTTTTTTTSSSQQTGEEILFIRAFPGRFSSFTCSSLCRNIHLLLLKLCSPLGAPPWPRMRRCLDPGCLLHPHRRVSCKRPLGSSPQEAAPPQSAPLHWS